MTLKTELLIFVFFDCLKTFKNSLRFQIYRVNSITGKLLLTNLHSD